MKKAAVTFDLDLVNHLSGGEVDEMALGFPLFRAFCEENPWFKTTWFVRIDDDIERRFGNADYVFTEHADAILWLRENGHEVGWHFHSFTETEKGWGQNTDEDAIAREIEKHAPLVQKHQLKLLRMGWTYHSNRTMKTVNQLGLLADCSALPRPSYSWDMSVRDWSITPETPYYPSIEDYRIPGNPCYSTLEFPISVAQVDAPYDTDENVLRYLNPCYHSQIFRKGLAHYNGDYCNLLSHPYEFLPNEKPHGLLSFEFEVFKENIIFIKDLGYHIVVLGDLVKDFTNN